MMERGLARCSLLVAVMALAGGVPLAAARAQPVLPPLTTVSGSPRLPGKFVWADLVTDDVRAASTFYARLFGWTFEDTGGYLLGANDERPLCGMFQRERPKDRTAEPRWFGYISVSSVGRARDKVTEAGGRVLAEPKKMPKRGEQAVFSDPEGALFGVVKSSSGDPEDFMADAGDWIWIQLLSRDARKAAEFYRSIAQYKVIENTQSNRLSDYVLASEGFARATVRTISASHPEVKATWLPFVRVKKVSETVTRTKDLGGKVLVEPRAEVFEGKVAVIADPTGAAIGVMEWPEGLAKGGP